jgi:hypothetical protein
LCLIGVRWCMCLVFAVARWEHVVQWEGALLMGVNQVVCSCCVSEGRVFPNVVPLCLLNCFCGCLFVCLVLIC